MATGLDLFDYATAVVFGLVIFLWAGLEMLRAKPPGPLKVILFPIVFAVILVGEAAGFVLGTPHSIAAAMTFQYQGWGTVHLLRSYGALVGALVGVLLGLLLRPILLARLHPNHTVERDARKSSARPSP
jgi:hypothetical protein